MAFTGWSSREDSRISHMGQLLEKLEILKLGILEIMVKKTSPKTPPYKGKGCPFRMHLKEAFVGKRRRD